MFVVFDLDGTLTDTSHRQHYVERAQPDYNAYHEKGSADPAREKVITLMNELYFNGHTVEIWTGRPEEYRIMTELWLRDNEALYDALRMRPTGDYQDVNLMKCGWMWEYKSPDLVFDDRRKCVEWWRGIGITCLQVVDNG